MNTYTLSRTPLLGWLTNDSTAWLVRDSNDDTTNDYRTIDARARSGDYFADLATRLENIVITEPATASLLDHIIYELSYIERRYNVTPKSRL